MSLQEIQVLLFVAAMVSMLCRRVKLPYTVGLTLAGLGLALLPGIREITLTKELIFSAFLPPLIFDAAFRIRWKDLRQNALVISALAIPGVLISVAIVCWGLVGLLSWPIRSALALAVLISATDPVAVIATFRNVNVPARMKLLVESESLFNDGTAAVLFSIALAFLGGHSVEPMPVVSGFVLTVIGSGVCGALVAGVALLLAGRAEDHLVEVTLTSLAAYASFLVAEQLHCSGVLATLTAGLVLGNFGALGVLSSRGREAVESFWEYVAFVANSLVFLLIGLRVAHHSFSSVWLALLVVIALSLVGRAAAVYSICALFVRTKHRVEARHQHVLVWGGLRGALALALALSLPESTPLRAEILSITFGVVAFSVIVQGLSVSTLLRRMKLLEADTLSLSDQS